tara:strand:+ start:4225 stop:5256 length:1032 start_codon:yes stop_codon:yes gene_type:complete
MVNRSVSRSISSVILILEFARKQGIDPECLLAGTHLQELMPFNPIQMVNESQELRLLDNLAQAVDSPFLAGFELGMQYQLTSYGIWGFALLASPSLGKAIELGLRYVDLTYSFCDISLRIEGQEASMVYTSRHDGLGALMALGRDIGALLLIQREVFNGEVPRERVELISPEPDLSLEQRHVLNGLAQCPVIFSANRNAVVLSAEILDKPLPRANAVTLAVCEQQCRDLLATRQEWLGFAEQVRNALLHSGLGSSMERVASFLNMSSRTMHRQLAEEGTQWRVVRDDVRLGMAEALLSAGYIQLDEIAERVGYSDLSNFSHAFRRWKGVSPAQYRRQQLDKSL